MKAGPEPAIHDPEPQLWIEQPSAQRQNVGMVVFTAKLGLDFTVRVGRTDSRHLVPRNGYPDSRTTHQNS